MDGGSFFDIPSSGVFLELPNIDKLTLFLDLPRKFYLG